MPSHLKALPVILAAALVLFWIAGFAWPALARDGELRRLRWAFLLLTLLAFASPSIWVYVMAMPVVVAAFLVPAGDRGARAATLWAGLLLAVPSVGAYLPGFGGIGNFFEMTHARALTMALLVPALVWVRQGPRAPGPLGVAVDWFVLAFFAVQLAVVLPYASRTDLIRQAFVLCLDTLLPYWVFSRVFQDPEGLRSALRAFVLTAMVLSVLAVFESVRRWPLYDAVPEAWHMSWDLNVFLERAGLLRAKASAGHSLVLGSVLVVALGFWAALRHEVPRRWLGHLGTLGLVAGLAASMARGSWLGALLLGLLLLLLGAAPIKRLLLAGVAGAGALLVAAQIPAMRFVVDLLPFIGEVDAFNVTYRQRLFEISIALISNSPWLGVPGYLDHMEELRQGQGIIDIVNSYLAIGLATGVVGLGAFVGGFATMLWSLWRLQRERDAAPEGRQLAACLLATTLSLMFVLVTTSSIVIVPAMTYMLLGLGVSCARLYLPQRDASHALAAAALRHGRL
ncbi:MAG: O-antigen ligase family protein [Burkholderiales bacterium]|nr:O-antigen ligase family protein [Burkholderiales bacterium]